MEENKNIKLKNILFALALMCITAPLIAGCQKNLNPNNKADVEVENLTKEDNNLVFYIYNTENDVTIEKKITKEEDKKYSPQEIVDFYRELFIAEDNTKEEMNNIPTIKVNVKNANEAHLCLDKILENVGSGLEGMYLEYLSQSVLDNVSEIKKVYINVNGENYESGHIYVEQDEIFKQK